MSMPPEHDPDRPALPPQWEALLRQVLGPDADAVLRELNEHGGLEALGLTGPDGEPLDLAQLAEAAGLPEDPAALSQIMEQVQRMLAGSGDGPVNWDLAHDLARRVAVAAGDPSVDQTQRREVTAAFSVAELWLDAATDLPPTGAPARVWSRSEWVEHTLGTWRTLSEPVAESVATALAETLEAQAPGLFDDIDEADPADPLAALAAQGGLGTGEPGAGGPTMLRRLGGAVFGMQVGQAAGTLSREVFGGTDIGLPLADGPGSALVPRNVAEFAEGLDVPADEVRIFLALREAAHTRLFTHVTWLRGHLLEAVRSYARGISIDTDALEDAVRSIDPTDPRALQEALSGGVFALATTSSQKSALLRLETALALVEGWVDEVTAAAAAPHLPHTAQLREMMRRRRAAGGPAEDTFATLVGLELRPRRSREAAALWARLTADGGTSARDSVWDHPDLLPTAEDLDDPAAFVARRGGSSAEEESDVDRALAEIFGEQSQESDPLGGEGGDAKDEEDTPQERDDRDDA